MNRIDHSSDPESDNSREQSPNQLDDLRQQIKDLAPWHHDIQLTPELSTGTVFSETGVLRPGENEGVSLISPRKTFLRLIDKLYPDGLRGKRFLDCACNAGGYCFWVRERDIAEAVGFDVRQHWIDQAQFVQRQRTVAATDRLHFATTDLYDIPQQNWRPFDLTYFSGLFYHLPDPITGLKIAANLTTDVMIFNTSMMADEGLRPGLSVSMEGVDPVMSGVHELAWLPNSPETLEIILRWLGFSAIKILKIQVNPTSGRRRIHLIAARDPQRFDGILFRSDLV